VPTPPIYYPPTGPVDPGWGYPEYPVDPDYGIPENPPIVSPPPIYNPDDLPEHPEVPDLNAGNWIWVVDADNNVLVRAFVPWPLAVTHPDYDPNYPPEEQQPGRWVLLGYQGRVAWAWIPSVPSDSTEPDTPTVNPLPA
jgi:hypothetical protein